MRSRRVLRSLAPSFDCRREMIVDAVVVRNVDKEAEKVTAGEFNR